MSNIIRLVWFDLKPELKPPVWIIAEWIVFLIQIGVYGVMISQLVTNPMIGDYRQFYAVGLVIMITFDMASHTGRHFVEHAHEGRLPYLLSLPISRSKLFLAIALQGGAELSLMLAVPLTVTLLIIGNLTWISVVACTLTLFWLGFGVAGFMLGLSFIAFKSSDLYTAIVTGLSTIIIRFSTVLYPFIVLPSQYASAALFSPLTYGSDLVRLILGFDPSILLNSYYAVAVLTALSVSTLGLGLVLMQRLVEGVKSA
ncbi:MAG: ABC transporter permease [Candidatus Bathyarchaeota archaeon]|nr:ABC transporter permease [Candidatus Bathyarchaeota archaeon]MDH5495232.1 ABC transporter permease [Candidatus Bathyarchaeota archaeon]